MHNFRKKMKAVWKVVQIEVKRIKKFLRKGKRHTFIPFVHFPERKVVSVRVHVYICKGMTSDIFQH